MTFKVLSGPPKTKPSVPLEQARRVAEAVRDELTPYCEQIEIAGSIRRGEQYVGDIEIVAQPHIATDLFGNRNDTIRTDLEFAVDELVAAGRFAPRLTSAGTQRRGRRYQALIAVRAEIALDLFVVLPPAQWGAILAIRTGPAAFSEMLVTRLRGRGFRCEGGRVLRISDDREIPSPREQDFFQTCGVDWRPPQRR